MTDKLLARARKIATQGVAKDDGYTYHVPAKDLAEYREVISELVERTSTLRDFISERMVNSDVAVQVWHLKHDEAINKGLIKPDPVALSEHSSKAVVYREILDELDKLFEIHPRPLRERKR